MANRDDSIGCGKYAGDAVHWRFDGAEGWRRIEKDGRAWEDEGPMDEYCREAVLRHFGFDAPAIAKLYPLASLRHMSPEMLRARANERMRAVS